MSGHKPFSGLVAKMSPEAREHAKRKAAALRAEMPLYEVRTALELSQRHLAEILHVDQPAISRMERRTDMMLSTLARFIEAMGGTLEMRATFPEGTVLISGLAEVKQLIENADRSRAHTIGHIQRRSERQQDRA